MALHPTLGAIQSAGQFGKGVRVIPEVCIYFDRKLLRGNRASKVAADRFKAYDSPNFPPLVEMEVEEQVILQSSYHMYAITHCLVRYWGIITFHKQRQIIKINPQK